MDYSRKLSCRFLGGVMPLLNAALANQASEGWLRALDVSLNRAYKIKEAGGVTTGRQLFQRQRLCQF